MSCERFSAAETPQRSMLLFRVSNEIASLPNLLKNKQHEFTNIGLNGEETAVHLFGVQATKHAADHVKCLFHTAQNDSPLCYSSGCNLAEQHFTAHTNRGEPVRAGEANQKNSSIKMGVEHDANFPLLVGCIMSHKCKGESSSFN